MIDRSIALEALGALCTGHVTSVQEQASPTGLSRLNLYVGPRQNLSIKLLIPTVIDGDENSQVSRSCFCHIKSMLDGSGGAASPALYEPVVDIKKNLIMDEEEFFATQYDYDFANLTETETYWRGGEKYERPCGWYRFGLKVLDKYCGNTWLGTTYRSTQSCPEEWPVSYHGTSKKGADGIIGDHYKPGPGQAYGRGIYSTSDISEANRYAKTFTSIKNGKTYKVVLQNRVNPEYRKKYNNDLYWLVPIPQGTSEAEEQLMVERAIRPYGLLLKEPGPGQAYGRGIYSTSDISEANRYAKTFTSIKNGKTYKVVLQNRVNPEYRKKYNNDLYWLVPIPQGTSEAEEQLMVERAIRPYGLLLKEV